MYYGNYSVALGQIYRAKASFCTSNAKAAFLGLGIPRCVRYCLGPVGRPSMAIGNPCRAELTFERVAVGLTGKNLLPS